jgi:signal transduction histidine kinase
LGSAAVALIVIAIAGLVIRLNAVATLHASDVSVATTDLASFEKDITDSGGMHVDPPAEGILILIRDPEGKTVETSLPHDVQRKVEDMKPSDETFSASEDGSPYVVVAQRLKTRSGTWALWAARSTESSDIVLARLEGQIIVGGLLALVAFTGAAWLLATFALRPVTAMRRRAETLSGSREGDRLPVGVANDEIAALAATLNKFLDRVHDSTARERRMVSDAAHELRTPLAALHTQLELAHDDFGNAAALQEEILGAEKSVSRLTALANGLLELSRLEGEERTFGRGSGSALMDEAMGCIDRARILALSKNIDVSFTAEGLHNPDAEYPIDPDAFARIVDNLLVNAVNAVDREGIVELTLDASTNGLRITVEDNGPGISPDFLPVAFDRFSRPDESRSSSGGGGGLGLALVKAIAEASGGDADLRNVPSGFVATVRIPKM